MKKLIKLTLTILFVVVYLSCSKDNNIPDIDFTGSNPRNNNIPSNNNSNTPSLNIYFGFLDGPGSSNTYIDLPIESSSTNLLIGRWIITKVGVDENNDNHVEYYNYQDFNHKDCGLSFLQFNNDGIAFENCYYNDRGICTLYTEIDNWELIDDNLRTTYYNNIFLIHISDTELILKYDWNFENSLWGPMQTYYHYERSE